MLCLLFGCYSLMPVSSEFVTLCKAQIMLLTQALGASISIVYLTQELVDGAQPQLIPIAAYPESMLDRTGSQSRRLPAIPGQAPDPAPALDVMPPRHPEPSQWLDPANLLNPNAPPPSPALGETVFVPPDDPLNAVTQPSPASALVAHRQLVLPLVSDDHVLGLLVTRRDDRAWDAWEQAAVTEIARTIANACVLDQRYQWGQQEREQERLLQLQQHDLMNNLLHQLRNSLTALQTFGKLILRRLTPGDRGHELASSITRETERLRDLAQQMELALATGMVKPPLVLPSQRLAQEAEEQLGDATLEPRSPQLRPVGLLPSGTLTIERCLLESVLMPLLDSAQAIAQDKLVNLTAQIPEDLPPIWADAKALREALNNLIENAIKYTPPQGQIWITVVAPDHSPHLELQISDTGVGIPTTDLPHIFERHFRGVQAQGEIPGSGLGLAITRSLIEQMQGKIQVFSPALPTASHSPGLDVPERVQPGSGTTFVVQLPIAL